jgi:hypothetical protein
VPGVSTTPGWGAALRHVGASADEAIQSNGMSLVCDSIAVERGWEVFQATGVCQA